MIIWWHSLIAFRFLRPHFDSEFGNTCVSTLDCLVTHLHQGLLHGGGVGDYLGGLDHKDPQFQLRFLFE